MSNCLNALISNFTRYRPTKYFFHTNCFYLKLLVHSAVTCTETVAYGTWIMWCQPTCQVLYDCCHVDRCPHTDAVFVCAGSQVPHHPPYREDDTCSGWTWQLGGLLLSSSGWHSALDTEYYYFKNLSETSFSWNSVFLTLANPQNTVFNGQHLWSNAVKNPDYFFKGKNTTNTVRILSFAIFLSFLTTFCNALVGTL